MFWGWLPWMRTAVDDYWMKPGETGAGRTDSVKTEPEQKDISGVSSAIKQQ